MRLPHIWLGASKLNTNNLSSHLVDRSTHGEGGGLDRRGQGARLQHPRKKQEQTLFKDLRQGIGKGTGTFD